MYTEIPAWIPVVLEGKYINTDITAQPCCRSTKKRHIGDNRKEPLPNDTVPTIQYELQPSPTNPNCHLFGVMNYNVETSTRRKTMTFRISRVDGCKVPEWSSLAAGCVTFCRTVIGHVQVVLTVCFRLYICFQGIMNALTFGRPT
jgi:hypothetical protein